MARQRRSKKNERKNGNGANLGSEEELWQAGASQPNIDKRIAEAMEAIGTESSAARRT